MTKRLPAALAALFLALPLALSVVPAASAAGFQTLDRQQARQLVEPARYRQPTVLALWASDCVHCKKNLALFRRLQQRGAGFQLITVATEPDHPELARILDGHQLRDERFAYGSDAPEALAFALDPQWRGELPRTLIFDGQGGLQKLSGSLDEKALKQALYPSRK